MITISRKDVQYTYMCNIFYDDIGLYPIFDGFHFQCNTCAGEKIIPIPEDIIKGGNAEFCISDKMGCPMPKKARRLITKAKKEYDKFEFTDYPKARTIRQNARIALIKILSDAVNEGYNLNYWKNGKIKD